MPFDALALVERAQAAIKIVAVECANGISHAPRITTPLGKIPNLENLQRRIHPRAELLGSTFHIHQKETRHSGRVEPFRAMLRPPSASGEPRTMAAAVRPWVVWRDAIGQAAPFERQRPGSAPCPPIGHATLQSFGR